MTEKHQKLLDTIIETAREYYADDIAIIILYGSAVNGTMHDQSDLDLIVVPKTEKGWNFAKTFILDGIGYDLWAVSWSKLSEFVQKTDMRTAILADSVLLYYCDESDRETYELMKKNASAVHPLNAHDYRPVMDFIQNAKQYYGELCLSGNTACVGGIVMELMNALCRLNRTYLRFGTKKILEETALFELIPPDFIENVRCVMLDTESAVTVCGDLIRSVEDFVRNLFSGYLRYDALGRCVTGLYEEISSHWNKIRYACKHDDAVTAFLAASSLQAELDFAAEYLGMGERFDLFEGYDPARLAAFSEYCDAAERKFAEILAENHVPVTVFNSPDELKEHLISVHDDE